MEARKITVVSTKTQKKSVIISEAETLRELKADLSREGIDYTDMTFYEGTSKTELMLDDSILPKDVPYTSRTTGETVITNELVFMLTNTNKKIKSGAMSRSEVYELIKSKNLQDTCIRKYGKNFTRCSTKSLMDLIADEETIANSMEQAYTMEAVDKAARKAIRLLSETLYTMDRFPFAKFKAIVDCLKKVSTESPYSDAEIEDMFQDIL